ncbi:putative C-type cyclin [Triangularia verruculosa]|uniref:RNA polymerase II holoenzyme cyclin-like subunit n=1 Tax=Triangularia verruculosa TaxID=2587418 RepID=A0AAN6X9R9_9PEZI|nr:putative C-type cyclin [Triangularia verruculosa]
MAPSAAKPTAPATNGQPAAPAPADDVPIGPVTGLSEIATQYISEQTLQQMLKAIAYEEAKDDHYRIRGVQLIDNVREALQLPVKTFDTAAIYYHRFRIRFPSSEYNYEDVALATLFVACKAEDTIKKSRDVLCAAHNLRSPHDRKTPDDKHFDGPSKFTIGLERHILETIGFDFRVQYPQKLLIKMIKKLIPEAGRRITFPRGEFSTLSSPEKLLHTAYDMSIDMYKTFVPIKQTTLTMVLAILQLTAMLMKKDPETVTQLRPKALSRTQKACVYETMLDLMDLYITHPRSTKVGLNYELQQLMDVKIEINKRLTDEQFQRYNEWCKTCADLPESHAVTPASVTSPASGTTSAKRKRTNSEGTLRFVFDAEAARKEKSLAAEYFNDEYEEYEVEVEEEIKAPPTDPRQGTTSGRGSRHGHHGGHHNNRHDYGYHNRGGRHPYHDNRHRGNRRGGPGMI